eukprot:SAG25_NODE_8924_length_396_cov_2.656566_1_plen_48_part_01
MNRSYSCKVSAFAVVGSGGVMLAALLGAMLPPCSSPKQRLGAMLAALL